MIKELLEKLDLPAEIADAEKPLEAFEEAFKVKYTSKAMILKDPLVDAHISAYLGKKLGSLTVKLQQIAGLTQSDTKDLKIEDLIDLVGEKHISEVTTLKEAATKGNDEKLSSITEELEKTKKTANKYKTDLEQVSTTYKQDQEKWSGELKNYKIKTLLNSELSKVTFIDNIKALEKEGYDSTIGRKYKFDLDENEKLIVLDEKGEPIQNPKKLGSYFTPGEVLTTEALNNGILKQNNASTTTKTTTHQAAATVNKPVEGRKLAVTAIQNAEAQKI